MGRVIILDNLAVKADKKKLINKLQIRIEYEKEFVEIFNQAKNIAKPKALYAQKNIQSRSTDYILIEDIKFCSKVLSVNLKNTYKVYPYLATAGLEIERWSEDFDDYLIRYWIDIIKEEILAAAVSDLFKIIDSRNKLVKAAHMNPGSIKDWPVDEQQKLFQIFGGKESEIGISLNASMLMHPKKSVSGIRFLTEVDYENCQLCKRENCPSRSAAYKPDILNKKYLSKNNLWS